MIQFDEGTDPDFIEFIKTIVVEIHTDETKEINGITMGKTKFTDAYTNSGEAIVIDNKHAAEIIKSAYSQIQNYVRLKYNKKLRPEG